MNQEILSQFLQDPGIVSILKEAKAERGKIKLKLFLLAIVCLGILGFLIWAIPESQKQLDSFPEFILIGIFWLLCLYAWLIRDLDPRRTVMSKLAPLIDKNLSYEFNPSYFPEWIGDERLVGNYDFIEKVSNHFKYTTTKTKGAYTTEVLVEGFQIVTTKQNMNGKQIPVCDAFITEIRFSGNRFHLTNDVIVKTENKSIPSTLRDFSKRSNQTMLESNEFERMFDVQAKDPIEARDLLNPHTMHALIHFKSSLPYDGSYKILFTGNSIFLKHYLNVQEVAKRKFKWYQFPAYSSRVFAADNFAEIFANKKRIYTDFYDEFMCFKNLVDDFDPFYRA